jgi:hypothetical protein
MLNSLLHSGHFALWRDSEMPSTPRRTAKKAKPNSTIQNIVSLLIGCRCRFGRKGNDVAAGKLWTGAGCGIENCSRQNGQAIGFPTRSGGQPISARHRGHCVFVGDAGTANFEFRRFFVAVKHCWQTSCEKLTE